MTEDAFEYEVAISFAHQDQAIADEFKKLLEERNITVFLDKYDETVSGGKDPLDHLVNIYARKARYCVLLISRNYPLRQWTQAERKHAQERALRDAEEYILPILLDDTNVTGRGDEGFRDLRQHPLKSIVDFLVERMTVTKRQSGPPAQSHDLRSGNVPSSHGEQDG